MPRLRVIILDQDGTGDFRIAMWADVPAARQSQYANANATSAWPGAVPADITALQSGAVTEQVVMQRIPSGAGLPQIESYLQSQWINFQNTVNGYNPWQRYGTTWDGTTWAVQNNG